MTPLPRSTLPLAACVAVVMSTLPLAAAPEVRFAPHRAVYDIRLVSAASGAGVASMTGRMVYELSGSHCEGYTQNMRFVTRMGNQEGAETTNDLRNSSWEDAAGKRLRFSTTQFANEVLAEQSQGDAKRETPLGPARVDLVKPAKSQFEVSANTLFPMQHARAVIEAAKRGDKLFATQVFDGAEKGTKIYLTNTVIGKPGQGKALPTSAKRLAAIKDAARLEALQSWPIAISYFELGKDKQDVPPAYELVYQFYENGVTSELQIDYGEFKIAGELKDLTFLPETACGPSDH